MLLFIFWITVLAWCLTKIKFVRNAGLRPAIIIGLFLLKILVGIIAGWLVRNAAASDTWDYHHYALEQYHLLFTNPKTYFTNIFYSYYGYDYGGVLQAQNSYWSELRVTLIIKLISVFDVYSGGNYYINVIFYNFVFLFGQLGLYRVFKNFFPESGWASLIISFLLPSLLFYSSTIHKDGIVLACFGILLFNFYQIVYNRSLSFFRIIYIVAALGVIFLFRNFIVFALIPVFTAWLLCRWLQIKPLIVYAIVYVIAALLFFNLHKFIPAIHLPQYLVQRQADFLTLEKGNTTIKLDSLEPTAISFLQAVPQALQHGMLRPFVTDFSLSKMLLPLSFELLFYEASILLLFFYRKKQPSVNTPFILFCICFGITSCLIIGYTVPIIGAIVRYRSIYLPFLLAPVWLTIDWEKLIKSIKIKK